MSVTREALGSPLKQGEDEQIQYQITTTAWGTSPATVSFVVKSNGLDVTATNMPGNSVVSGDVITLPALRSLTAGSEYRVEVKFTAEGNIWETYFTVSGEK